MSNRGHRRIGGFSSKERGFISSIASRSNSNSSSSGKRYGPTRMNTRRRFNSSSRSMSKSGSEYGYRSESVSISNSRSNSRSAPSARSRQGQRKSIERGRSKDRVRRSCESSPEGPNYGYYHRHSHHYHQDERDYSRSRRHDSKSRRSQKLRSVSSSGDTSEYRGIAHERSGMSYLRDNAKNSSRITTTSRVNDEYYELKNTATYSYSKSVPRSRSSSQNRSSSRSRSRSASMERNRSESRNRGRNKSRDKIRQREKDWDKERNRSKSVSVSRSRPSSKSKYISESQSKYKSRSRVGSRSRSNPKTKSIPSLDDELASNSLSKTARRRSEYYTNDNGYEQQYDNDHGISKSPGTHHNYYNIEYANRPTHGYNHGHGNNYYNNYERDGYNYGDRNWKNSRYSNRYRDRHENYVNRSFSEERERSRERERRRRRLQAECIKKAGGFQKLAQSEGKEPTPVFYDGFQWVAKTGSTASMDPATMNNTRRFRRLYFGNLPLNLGLTESNFQQVVWQEMALRGLCLNPNENPILCVWFAQKKGNYGFIEFRTVEETEKALELDGFACMGSKIKVSRPNDYSQALQSSSSGATEASIQSPYTLLSSSFNTLNSHLTINGAITKDNAMCLGQQAALQLLFSIEDAYPLGTLNLDSKVLRISNVLDPCQIQNPEEYQEIKRDFCDGIQYKDSIISSKIITIEDISGLCQELAERNILLEPADILLEFDSNSNLQLSVSAMSIAKYDNKIPKMNLFDEDFYHSHLKR
ncbi:splicing factor U2AF like auxilary factor large subunit [Cryptosporidium sp. chipmunk genotype I]|uniref:splicing factor U2AF like auxilary factor large subunit n=1 Tax=Cryptosporidium sp. chipmunk genotype I TaxID=1280935 RepID=UPI00351A14C5|nr:splicing factor U2AF like auxilary factor large subunit [Cryptosporidium sp. chipmunk genotype I]